MTKTERLARHERTQGELVQLLRERYPAAFKGDADEQTQLAIVTADMMGYVLALIGLAHGMEAMEDLLTGSFTRACEAANVLYDEGQRIKARPKQ